MKPIPRRKFIQSTAMVGGSLLLLPAFKVSNFLDPQPSGNYFLKEFGIDETLCRKLLAKALSRGGDFADLYFEFSVSNYLGLEDGKVNQSYGDISLGVGIRTVKGDQIGYGFTQDLTEDSMISAAATASTLCDSQATPVSSGFRPLKIGNYYPLAANFTGIPGNAKLPLLQDMNQKCFALSPEIVKVNAGFSSAAKRMMVVSSDGVQAEDFIPSGFVYASVVAERKGKREQSFWNLGGRRDLSFYTDKVINEVATKAVNNALNLFDAVQPPAGEMPVVLGPGVTGILLHEAIGHGMEADFNRKNISTFSTMIGKKVAEPFVTIIDDGTNMNLSGSINVDDEGTPGKKTVLVQDGILTSYLHDKISARHYGVEPTGNGRRQDFQNYPIPRMRNTYMLGGKASPEDVFKQAGNGIFVEDVSNGQVKIGEGDFAFYVSKGRMIENGKLTAPIKDVNIMGNGPKMLSNIIMAANDLEMFYGGAGQCGKNGQGVPVSFGLPTCLVKSLTVGGTQQERRPVMTNAKDQQTNFRELADWVIAETKKLGAQDCRVSISKRRLVEINYRDHKPEVIKEATTKNLYLEVFIDKRFAGQSTPDFRQSTLAGFISGVVDSAKIMEEDPFRTLPDPKYYEGRTTIDLQLSDPDHSMITPENRHDMVKTVENACLLKGGDKVISVEAGEYDESSEEFVKSSNGFEGSTRGTYCQAGASMTAKDEGDRRPAGYHYIGCRYKSDLPSLQDIGTQAAVRTLDLMGGKKIATSTIPVILENRGVARILSGLFEPMSGGSIQQKRSFLADKKGTTIGSKLLTLSDDPFLPRGLGSKYYDGDGFPAKKRDIFKDGVINEFLIDWYYSRKLGWEPTSGSISNLIIPPGQRSVESIIKDLGKCILITDYIGGNSNSTTGDFSVGIIGKLFDKGQFVQNVAEMNIADNHLKFWNKLVEVANDPWIYSQARLPSLVFDGVVVSGV